MQEQHGYSLGESDQEILFDVSTRAAAAVGDPHAMAQYLLDLPEGLTRSLLDFARGEGTDGFLLLRGVDVGSVPETPVTHGGSPLPADHPSAATLALVADVLGALTGYQDEKNGALIHEVHPVRGEEERIENSGSVKFDFHTENVHHPLRPDFLGLLCLRQDHDAVATTRVASVRNAIPKLTLNQIAVLREPQFRSLYPTSFTRGTDGPRPSSGPHPVIFGHRRTFMRFNSHNTQASDARGEAALTALAEALEEVSHEVLLSAGDLVVIDNHMAAHGRSAFVPRYDGRDRWLRRFYSVRSVPRWTEQMIETPRVLPSMTELQGVL